VPDVRYSVGKHRNVIMAPILGIIQKHNNTVLSVMFAVDCTNTVSNKFIILSIVLFLYFQMEESIDPKQTSGIFTTTFME
jgi:hypothetical protein